MKYNFYDRKETRVPKYQIDWINENIELISNNENVLFAFQANYEALLITDKSIYFPNRETRRKISYQEITKIKRAGDFLLELIIINSKKITIVFVTPIDKVKMFRVLNLLLNNSKKGITTSFEDTNNIFSDYEVLKYPLNQLQHKLPQVYLKQFGYLHNDQWMVSIMQRGEKFTRQKSIGSFTAETNVFDIESEDDRFPRILETMNADLENLYHEMLDDISKNSTIPDKCWEIIVQLVPNLIIRSDYWRDFVKGILESEQHKEAFLEITLSVHTKSFKELQDLKEKQFYKVLAEGKVTNSNLNRTLIHFMNYIFYHLKYFNLVIIEAQEEKLFFTSDNPVNFKINQEEGKKGLFSKNTEVYFPISKNYLAYFYNSKSSNEEFSSLRQLNNRGVYKATEVLSTDEYDELVKNEIIRVSDKLIISPEKIQYRKKI